MTASFSRKQHYFVLFILLLITVGTRIPFQGPYLYDGDPVAYFDGAENILQTGKYQIGENIPIWPIGTSLTLVPFIFTSKILGLPTEASAFWHGVFFIFLAVAFTYLLGKRIFNPATGIIAALLLSLAESPFIYSINLASDPGSLAMLLGATYLMLLFLDTQAPRDLFFSFFLLGFAFVFRWNYVFFLPLFLIFLIGDRRIWAFYLYPSFWLLGFLGFLSGISIQLFTNFSQFGNPFTIGYSQVNFSTTFVFKFVDYLLNILRVIYRILFTWDFFSPLLAVFGFIAILGLWREKRRDVLWLLTPWVVLGTLSVIYFGVKPRLLIPIMPPLFLIGADGMVRVFYQLKHSIGLGNSHPRITVILYIIMALILFSPMLVRTLLYANGHFQDKVVMQQAFRWAGEQTTETDQIITQPIYAGHNPEWLKVVGKDVWASKRYAGRKIRSLAFPNTWSKTSKDWFVINQFWFEGENMRFDNTREVSLRFDSLRSVRHLELKARFEGKPEPLFLKKLNMLSYYPIDFMEYRPSFEIWGPPRK